jgi:hypothetical protein
MRWLNFDFEVLVGVLVFLFLVDHELLIFIILGVFCFQCIKVTTDPKCRVEGHFLKRFVHCRDLFGRRAINNVCIETHTNKE